MSIVRSPQGYFLSTLLANETWLSHAFGTAAAAPPHVYLVLNQVHSNVVLLAGECGPDSEGDGLITNEAGLFVAAKSADCVPLLLADPVHHVVAAVHAGWRGSLANIAGAAVERMTKEFDVRPSDLVAALGPSIGPCCFEVGPEVAVLFRDVFSERNDLDRRTTIDLWETNRRHLRQAGLLPERIDTPPPCTCCGGKEFYSWRRDHIQGQRMFAAIGRLPNH
ncbi:peptidoglycan editing factor PgeF [uncultured Paludibaculum sp.]|uniref:peptidoglycan editing factor PgeF n=1 Tax=uncultured Paludibaculum sp. TaxID=1765020 RepID=UPI002AAB6477|nr:peptidoglycan editing factor PgeF [uncultured Paludibaculum sp.]